jgi:hypothetical protein
MVNSHGSSSTLARGARYQCFFSIDGGALPDYQLQHLPVGPPSTFFMLMMDAPGSLSASHRSPPLTFISVDGGRYQITSSNTSQGAAVDVFYVDGGRSRIFVSTRQEARHQHFLYIDGRRSRISDTVSQGSRC